jgi:hypothetical protein
LTLVLFGRFNYYRRLQLSFEAGMI